MWVADTRFVVCLLQRLGWNAQGLHSTAARAAESDAKDPKILKELMDDHTPNDFDDALKAELEHATGLERMELEAAVQVCSHAIPRTQQPSVYCLLSS